MILYKGYEYYAVNTGGYWWGVVYKDGKNVARVPGYEREGNALHAAKRWIDKHVEV